MAKIPTHEEIDTWLAKRKAQHDRMSVGASWVEIAEMEIGADPRIQIDKERGVCALYFRTNLVPYEIDLDRVKDERDLLAWTVHLCGKGWFSITSELVDIVEAIAAAKGLDCHHPC